MLCHAQVDQVLTGIMMKWTNTPSLLLAPAEIYPRSSLQTPQECTPELRHDVLIKGPCSIVNSMAKLCLLPSFLCLSLGPLVNAPG